MLNHVMLSEVGKIAGYIVVLVFGPLASVTFFVAVAQYFHNKERWMGFGAYLRWFLTKH